MGYKVLILVDHGAHTAQNSVYNLTTSLLGHRQVAEVFVASRSTQANRSFFFEYKNSALAGVLADQTFSFDVTGHQFDRPEGRKAMLGDFDLILLRLPFPVQSDFFRFLEMEIDPHRVINRPGAIEITGSKAFLLNLQEVCPPVELCENLDQVIAFHKKYDLVLKPLRSYGGAGILKLQNGTLSSALDGEIPLRASQAFLADAFAKGGFLAMKYLTKVDQGDKRIVVVNGKIVGASLRMPAKGSWLCNVSQGGTSQASLATPEEVVMADFIHHKIAPLGIGIFGMDTLVDDDGQRVLSEINTMSVGGIGPMDGQSDRSVSQVVANELIEYYKKNNR